jgi:hypothetical protein
LSSHYIPEQFKLEKIPYTASTTLACPYPRYPNHEEK